MGDVFHQCPRCSDDLPWQATSCACGWKKRARPDGAKRAPPREPVACAHDGCSVDATLRVKTPTGWANLCRAHYASYYQSAANAFCVARGVAGVSEQRQFIRERLREFKTAAPGRDWMDRINQAGVDVLIEMGERKVLEELRERGVIEDDGRLVPLEQRAARKALPAPAQERAA